MKVGSYQNSSACLGSTLGRVAGGGSAQALAGVQAKSVQQAGDSQAVVDSVDYGVYSAVDDFLCLSGDARLESYSQLPEQGKRKFMKVMDRLVEGGDVDKAKFDLGESSPSKEAFLNDYVSYSDGSSSPYSAKGRIAN
jgi:hypothetical protein